MLFTAFSSAFVLLLPVVAWKVTRRWRTATLLQRIGIVATDLVALVAIPDALLTAVNTFGSLGDDVGGIFGIVLVDRRVALALVAATLLLVLVQLRTSRDRLIKLDLTR